jgi:putative oxidoreductase
LDGTSGWLESISYRPAKPWDALAERSELGGGALAALGIVHPLRPIITFGAMAIGTPDVHVGQPVWAAEGGAALLITNMAATAVSLTSPSAFLVDPAFDIHVPKSVASLAVLGVAVRAVVAERLRRSAPRAW